MRNILIVLTCVFLAACAAPAERQSPDRFEEMAVYERHAGAPENWVRYTSVRNWWAVGLHSVVFEFGGSRHYLVDLIGACDLDLGSAATLKLVGSRRNVLSEFDKVIVSGRACQIRSIKRLDYEAVKSELEGEGKAQEMQGNVTVEREDQPSGGT